MSETTNHHSQPFPKASRLLSGAQFRRVFDAKQSVSDSTLVLYGALNELEHSRLGLAVSKKVGNAVVRNIWKRQIREAFRLQQDGLPCGLDFIVLPRRGAEPAHHAVADSLLQLAMRVERRVQKNKGTVSSPSKPHHGRGRGKR